MKVNLGLSVLALSGPLANAFAPSKLSAGDFAGKVASRPISRSCVSRLESRYGDSRKTTLGLSTLPLQYPPRNPFRSIQRGATSLVQRLRTDEVTKWRAAAFSFLSSLVLFRHPIDVKLAGLWQYLLTSSSLMARIFRTDSYEWVLAVSVFFVFIHLFGYADRVVHKAAEQGRAHPWRKYRLQDRYEADKHRRAQERRLEVTPTGDQSSLQAKDDYLNLQVKQTKWNWRGYLVETQVYILPLLAWDIISPRRHLRLGAFIAPTTLQVLRDVSCGLALYDLLFFTGHILMHKIPFIYRTIHTKHHEVQETRAGDIVRLSIPEEVMEVGFSIIALNALGVHPVSRTIYNCIIVFLLTELHCGFDFPWTPQNVVPFGLATGSRRHHYHHRNGKHYYQKFFFTVDRLLGFFQKDDGSLHGDSVKPNPYVPPSWK
jgi:sterol desaturase/sphingolipid hydroxylase (fatty acid hydroxylase superfamily)